MAGRLLLSVTLLLSGWGVSAAPKKGDDFFLGLPIANFDAPDLIPHNFIVVYKKNFTEDRILAHEANIMATIAKRNIGKRSPITGRQLSTGVRTVTLGSWHALTLEADDRYISRLFQDDEVDYIEQDAVIHLNAPLTQNGPPSGLARLSSETPGERRYVFDETAGEGITAFVVDTGIKVTHDEFEERATFAANFVDNVVSFGPALAQVWC